MISQIQINQSLILSNSMWAVDTDLIDWALIQYLREKEANSKQVCIDGRSFYHNISLREILHENPMLGIHSTGGICKRLQKLQALHLISLSRDGNDLFFKIGYNARKITDPVQQGGVS